MPLYRFHELTIDSSIELPELIETGRSVGPTCVVDYRIVTSDELAFLEHDQEASQQLNDDATAMTFGFGAGVEFSVSLSGDYVLMNCVPTADMATVRHLLLDHALPRLLEARGYFTAHASGVAFDDRALVFLGASGHGKSSMAASLHHTGFPLLGDDCFTLTSNDELGVLAQSTYRSLRLLPPSIEQFYAETSDIEFSAMGDGYEKVRLTGRDMTEPMPMPVAGIFVITEPGHSGPPQAEQLSGRDGVLALLQNSFRIDTGGLVSIGSSLDQAAEIVRQAPITALHYERCFDQIELLHRTVLESIS